MNKDLDKVIAAAKKVTAKRPRTVIDHIIKHGFITNEDLKVTYGYNHPPRAIGDVRDQGIPLTTYKVDDSQGRKIGAYKFGDASEIEDGKLGGRRVLPKSLKKALVDIHGPICAISREAYDISHLQIDHRVPYRVAGDSDREVYKPSDFMLLCGAAQRQKSWACEHCSNLINEKDLNICLNCYYATPEMFTHVALKQERRVDITFMEKEIYLYNKTISSAEKNGKTIQDFIKDKLR